jgi:hypothetical protein
MAWHRSRWAKMSLRIETLESRCLPTIITPTTSADGGPGSGSLRDAVLRFNADPGTDDDIIQLQPGRYALTIVNTHGHETAGLEGDLNITSTSHRLIIQGAGSSGWAPTIIDASQLQDRVFQIVNPGTPVVFQDLAITGGLAQDDGSDGALAGTTDALGGGILNNGGDVTLQDVVIANNVARGGDGPAGGNGQDGGNGRDALGRGVYSNGGALGVSGRIAVTNSTLSTNSARGGNGGNGSAGGNGGGGGPGQGGGLSLASGISAMITIVNSTLSANSVRGGDGGAGGDNSNGGGGGNGGIGGPGFGGGIFVVGGTLTLTNATVAFNTAEGSMGGAAGTGGVRKTAGSLNAVNSLFGDNSADSAPDFSGAFTNANHNLLGDGTGSNLVDGVNGNQVGTANNPIDPLLGPLTDKRRPDPHARLVARQPGHRRRQQRLRHRLGPARRRFPAHRERDHRHRGV